MQLGHSCRAPNDQPQAESVCQVVRVLAAFDFLVMLVLSNVIHDFDVTSMSIVDKPDPIR